MRFLQYFFILFFISNLNFSDSRGSSFELSVGIDIINNNNTNYKNEKLLPSLSISYNYQFNDIVAFGFNTQLSLLGLISIGPELIIGNKYENIAFSFSPKIGVIAFKGDFGIYYKLFKINIGYGQGLELSSYPSFINEKYYLIGYSIFNNQYSY